MADISDPGPREETRDEADLARFGYQKPAYLAAPEGEVFAEEAPERPATATPG